MLPTHSPPACKSMCGLHRERKDNSQREIGSKADRSLRVSKIIELMQLQGLEKHKPHQLSGGQQQRAALSRIIIGDPRLLMLDEPFSSLDSHLRGQLQIQLKEVIIQFGKEVLLVTHSRDEAYRLCGRIALIDDGKVVAHKDTKELFGDPESRRAALITGCKNIVDARKVGEHEVEVPQWGISLKTAKQVRNDLCAIGIRAHYFDPALTDNCFPIRIIGEMEEPFESIWQFRYDNQDESAADILWQTPKNRSGERSATKLGVAPEDVLPLYE